MTEREAIESTYFDTLSSFRRKNIKDEVTKQTKQIDVVVLSDIPCALSKNNTNSAGISFGSRNGEASTKYTLFHAPDFDIKAGDRLIIKNAQGQEFTCHTGKPSEVLFFNWFCR
jgi:hypothetical protein